MGIVAACAALLVAASAQGASKKDCGRTSSGTAIIAVGPTSCPFGRAVYRKWATYGTVEVAPNIGGRPRKTIRVYRRAAKRTVAMHCRTHVEKDNIFDLCTGGNGARVEIRS